MAYTRTGYANFAAFPVTGAANIIYVDLSNGNEYTWITSAYVAYTGTLAGIRTAYQTSAWFAANGSILLGKGQRVDLEQTGLFKLGDGVTLLSALEFKSSATHKDTAWFTANAAVVIEDKRLIYCSDGANQGKYKIGDGTTALSALTFYGGISASGLTVGTTTITVGTNTKVLYNNNGVVGEYMISGSGSVLMTSTIGSTVQGYSANTTLLGNSTTGSGSNIVLGTSPTFDANITVNGNVVMVASTATTGIFYKGSNYFLHDFKHPTGSTAVPQGFNIFLGENAGNLTMGSGATNVAFGSRNTGFGREVMLTATNAYRNVAVGDISLRSVTTGAQNTAIGSESLYAVTTTSNNVAIGYSAGRYLANGSTANDTPATSIYIGSLTKASAAGGSNEIVIGYSAIGTGSNTTTIGTTSTTNSFIFGGMVVGNQVALATNATTGFLHIPNCAGVPTGAPTLYTGKTPLVIDSTNNKMYIYSGGAWVALN